MKVITSVYNYLLSILFQFLVLLNQYKQDREPLSALALVCLCPAGPNPCSC